MNNFILLVVIHFLGVLSPGAAFIGVFNHSIIHKTHTLLYFILGIAIGDGVFIVLSLIGLSDIILKIQILNFGINLFGGVYLGYLAFKLITVKFSVNLGKNTINPSFKSGFLLTISNPKALIFYTALLQSFIANNPISIKIIYCIWMIFGTFLYFSLISIILHKIKHKILPYMKYFTKIFAIMLALLSFKLIYSALIILK